MFPSQIPARTAPTPTASGRIQTTKNKCRPRATNRAGAWQKPEPPPAPARCPRKAAATESLCAIAGSYRFGKRFGRNENFLQRQRFAAQVFRVLRFQFRDDPLTVAV